MRTILERVVALSQAGERAEAAAALGRMLGGDLVIVFLRDETVGALLPAPGFPQTLPNGREWRRFLDECVARGESHVDGISSPHGGRRSPAYGIASGSDTVTVVLGTDRRPDGQSEFVDLLPLLAAVLRSERAAIQAEGQARLAGQAAAHAEALAASLESVRGQLQRALEAAESARQAAEAANRAKSEFLATMSHELRTPLNAIGGHVQLVELGIHGPLTEAQRAALGRINRNQRHLLGLINDILNLAQIEAGRLEYRMSDVFLVALLADLRPMIAPQLEAKGHHFEFRCDDPEVTVRTDPEKFQQILLNLLSNAVKFTDPGGTIGVICERAEENVGLVRVRVWDTGTGIPPERLADIFEPFVQIDASHSRANAGAGLGLAISRDLVRGMGGELTVESVPGRGSIFTITLPAGTTSASTVP